MLEVRFKLVADNQADIMSDCVIESIRLDPEGFGVAAFISCALGMFQAGWQHRAGTMVDWMIESERAAASKEDKENRGFLLSHLHRRQGTLSPSYR